jgi:histidinol-phosphate aminotransferase
VPVSAAGEAHKLSSNESPYGPLPSVAEVIAEIGRTANRYPDNSAEALIAALAARFAVPADHLAVGCGSVGVLKQLMEAVSDPGAEVLYAWRSFEAYPPLADIAEGHLGPHSAPARDPRPVRHGRRDHPADPDDPRLQPEQPDRHGGPPR